MRAELDPETGELRAYVYKTVVELPEQIDDETNQLTLEQARELAPSRGRRRTPLLQGHHAPRPHRRADGQQVIFRRSAKPSATPFPGVRQQHRRNPHRHRQAPRAWTSSSTSAKPKPAMPKREQSSLEQFAVGERVRVVLLRVDRAARAAGHRLPRRAALVQSLFQSESPRDLRRHVMIRAIAAKPASAPRSPSSPATRRRPSAPASA